MKKLANATLGALMIIVTTTVFGVLWLGIVAFGLRFFADIYANSWALYLGENAVIAIRVAAGVLGGLCTLAILRMIADENRKG